MTHICTLHRSPFNEGEKLTVLQKWGRKVQHYTLISASNPFRFLSFKSDIAVRLEQKRHLSISNWVIHPYSSFRQWYDMYLIYLYISVLITKPFDVAFAMSCRTWEALNFKWYILFTDILCWIDIILSFLTGRQLGDGQRSVELRPLHIAKRYVLGPFFICDTLSSIPTSLIPNDLIHPQHHTLNAVHMVKLVCLLKVIRVFSIIGYIDKMVRFSNRGSRGIVFLVCNIVFLLIVIHWMACIQFGVSVAVRIHLWPETANSTWVSRTGMLNQTTFHQYVHSFFKSSAYILGVRLTHIYAEMLAEEYLIAIATYVLGKILVILTWTSIAVHILNTRAVSTKFIEVLNQLDEYMKQKQLPFNLQQRITSYYCFKYERKYLREDLITSLLPDRLIREVKLHECRSLISNITIFKDLQPHEVNRLVDCLELQIFLPNDSIILSRYRGEAMYFILTGTVAVYSRSGKEFCHLQDGAYFGEIALVLKNKTTMLTVVAIEACQIYKLSRRDFNRYLLTNEVVMNKLLVGAKEQLKVITDVEEDYWKMVFEKVFMHKDEKKQ